MAQLTALSDDDDFTAETLDLVAKVANAALAEVGMPPEHQLYVEVNGCAYFDGDTVPGDEWDEAIEKALALAWTAAGCPCGDHA